MSGALGFGKIPSADQLLATAKWAFGSVEVDVACNKYLVSYMIGDIRCQAAHHRTTPMSADKNHSAEDDLGFASSERWRGAR